MPPPFRRCSNLYPAGTKKPSGQLLLRFGKVKTSLLQPQTPLATLFVVSLFRRVAHVAACLLRSFEVAIVAPPTIQSRHCTFFIPQCNNNGYPCYVIEFSMSKMLMQIAMFSF